MRVPLLVLLCLTAVCQAGGQTTERPVPFDTAGRIVSVNAPLAERLGLTAPAWPVTGTFAEARLYRISTGGYSLAVTREGGAVDRYPLDEDAVRALRAAFAEGMARVGRVVAEETANVTSENARGPFVRDQMLLASIIYGPALASLTGDAAVGTGMYLLSVGSTFFGVNNFAQRRTITRAQNALTTDGALRGWAATALAANMFGLQPSAEEAAMMALVGGVGGSIVGYHRGRGLTNSEAQAARTISTLGAGAVLGLGATVGVVGDDKTHPASAATLIGGIAGYLVGPAYPRRASYSVTAGDVSLVRLGAVLGGMAAITPFADANDLELPVAAALVTTGWVGGALIADRIAVKPYNHSEGDARMIQLGALGGALMGAALPMMAKSGSGVFWMTMLTGGGLVGATITQGMMAPSREGDVMRAPAASAASASIELRPEGALFAATGQQGNHTILRIRF